MDRNVTIDKKEGGVGWSYSWLVIGFLSGLFFWLAVLSCHILPARTPDDKVRQVKSCWAGLGFGILVGVCMLVLFLAFGLRH